MDMHIPFVFFGTPELAEHALRGLLVHGLKPICIVSSPDKPVGRHQVLTPSPTKLWAIAHNIHVLTPIKINDEFISEISNFNCELFVVAAYGKILPEKLLSLPKFGTLNIHPSLLPLYRGSAPVVGPILNGDDRTGVTVIKIDAEVDHGPILAQDAITLTGNEKTSELGNKLFFQGGELLATILSQYLDGSLPLQEQDHTLATFTKKIKKGDGLISPADDSSTLWRKFRAYDEWPGIYFLDVNGKRVKITDAQFENQEFKILKVIPEGRKEISYQEFLKIKKQVF